MKFYARGGVVEEDEEGHKDGYCDGEALAVSRGKRGREASS